MCLTNLPEVQTERNFPRVMWEYFEFLDLHHCKGFSVFLQYKRISDYTCCIKTGANKMREKHL